MNILGNISLLDQPSVGFLCSRTAKSSAILPCLDWAVEKSRGTMPVMSTFHSELEDAVLDMLLRGKCPIILVLGRSIYKVLPEKLKAPLDDGRLLIISLSNQTRISRESARLCNEYICDHADAITFGFLSPESSLREIYKNTIEKGKQSYILQ